MKIPVGIENFEAIRTDGYYYVDKSKFIIELLEKGFFVNLITRPRRFGKTLMMSMLENFFDIRKNSRQLFQGLAVSENEKICTDWMNQWPILFISLKDIVGPNYKSAYDQLAYNISRLCTRHSYLLESEKVTLWDKNKMLHLVLQKQKFKNYWKKLVLKIKLRK